jgi:hypothetical protein
VRVRTLRATAAPAALPGEELHMLKSGLIFGAIALVLGIGTTYVSPLCTPCLALFLGLGAGYVACLFDKPSTSPAANKNGAMAGAVGGVGAIVGQVIGTVLNITQMGPAGAARFNQTFGLPSGGAGFTQGYWIGVLGGGVCFSVLDILLMAALGYAGALLWWQMSGSKANQTPAN